MDSVERTTMSHKIHNTKLSVNTTFPYLGPLLTHPVVELTVTPVILEPLQGANTIIDIQNSKCLSYLPTTVQAILTSISLYNCTFKDDYL